MNNNNLIVAILVVAVIVFGAWLAYREGLFQGRNANPSDQPEIQINLPGGSPTPRPTTPRYY